MAPKVPASWLVLAFQGGTLSGMTAEDFDEAGDFVDAFPDIDDVSVLALILEVAKRRTLGKTAVQLQEANARLKQYKYYFDIIGSTFKDIVQTVNPRRSHSSSNFSSVSLDKEDPDKTIEETSDYNRKREQIKKRRAHRQRSSSVSAVNKGSNLLTSLNSEFLMEIVNDKIKKSKESIDENFSLDLSKKVNSMVVDEYSPDKKNVDLVEEGKKFAIEFLRMRQRKK